MSRSRGAIGLVELAKKLLMCWDTGLKWFVRDRWFDPIQPTALIELARRGEGGAGDLLGVEPVGANQGAVLAEGEGAGDRLRREVVAEAGEVLDAGDAVGARPSLLLHTRHDANSKKGTRVEESAVGRALRTRERARAFVWEGDPGKREALFIKKMKRSDATC